MGQFKHYFPDDHFSNYVPKVEGGDDFNAGITFLLNVFLVVRKKNFKHIYSVILRAISHLKKMGKLGSLMREFT